MVYYIPLFIAIIFNITAQSLLKVGMNNIGIVKINQIFFNKLKIIIINPYIWSGIILYGFGFFLYAIALSKLNLNTAYTISSVVSIIVIVIISITFLNEDINISKIIGLSLCIIGVILIFLNIK